MMNKKNLWFLTLFSLVLVLSIYYVTMPEDLLAATTNGVSAMTDLTDKDVKVNVTESDAISTLKVEDTSRTNDALSELQEQLTKETASTEEKNKVYEQIKSIHTNSGLEETIEKKVNSEYSCETFAKVENTSVKVVVDGCENSKTLANNIMRLVQEQFEDKMYISVQFQS